MRNSIAQLGGAPATRAWWVSLALILLIGAFVQLYHFDNGTIIEQFDEPRLYQLAFLNLQGLPSGDEQIIGYPPGLLWLEQVIYCTVVNNSCTGDLPQNIPVIRHVLLLAALTNLVTALGIALLVRQWATPAVGLIAAAFWLLLPGIREETVIGLTEAWQASAIIFAALTMTMALKTRRPIYAILSVVAGLIAVVFKYSAFPTLGLGIAATLWLLWREKDTRIHWFATLIVQIALMAGCAALLMWGYNAREFFNNPNEVATFLSGETNFEFFSDSRGIFRIANTHSGQIMLPTVLVWAGLAGGMLAFAKRGIPWQWLSWGLGLGLFVFHLLFILSYVIYWSGVIRYVTPVSGLGLALLVSAGWAISEQLLMRLNRAQFAVPVFVGLSLVWLVPASAQSLDMALKRALPDTHDTYIRWTETSLPTDGTILIERNDWLYFSSVYGDYAVPHRTWLQGSFPTKPREEWLEQYVLYAYITAAELETLRSTVEGRAALAEMTLLRAFPPTRTSVEWRGPTFGVYWLKRPQNTAQVSFGEQIQFTGFDISDLTLRPGETLDVRPFWRAATTPRRDYNLYLHLVPLDTRTLIAQADGQPGLPLRPTSTWSDPDEVLLGSALTLSLPDDVATGEYRLLMGLYDWQTGERLTTQTGEDFTEVARITIQTLPG